MLVFSILAIGRKSEICSLFQCITMCTLHVIYTSSILGIVDAYRACTRDVIDSTTMQRALLFKL